MMNIDSITEGYVIDHIGAGNAMRLYYLLGLDKLECPVAIIKNVQSKKMGKKDIIKIDSNITIDLDALGYIDPGITVNIIHNGKLVEKKSVDLPERLHDVLQCKNPRCITSIEQQLEQVFYLADRENRVYRCLYCESKA
ncbi:MAG: aspartate carbamoyltransferase regulatory subunit [Acutalibacteraceae bacterium]